MNEEQPLRQERLEWLNNKLTVELNEIDRIGSPARKDASASDGGNLDYEEKIGFIVLIFWMGVFYGLIRQCVSEIRQFTYKNSTTEAPKFFSVRHAFTFIVGWVERATVIGIVILTRGYNTWFFLGIAIGSTAIFCFMLWKKSTLGHRNGCSLEDRNSRPRGS